MAGELGKASLDLEANLSEFERNIKQAERTSGGMEHALEQIATVARVAEIELNKVKMEAGQGAESRAVADKIERSIGSVGRAAMEASRHLEGVKLDASNAAETTAAGDVMDHKLKDITGNANEARRALESMHLAGFGAGGRAKVDTGRGVGPFGSGFGRVGLLGTAVGLGVLTAPAAAPAAAGLLAAIPTLAFGAAGAVGTLALAFDGVGKAIGGDKKAFDELQPSQQRFVQTVRSMHEWIGKLKATAGDSLFPGLTTGLRAALSPGTVSAITRAVQQFGSAIGAAGAQWGRYFGSTAFQGIFGPLMQAGARNLRVLSGAALSLFDALGRIGKAAIPLTNWLADAAAKGARLADSWIKGKEASGGLARGMHEAQTSLRLVGGLVAALGRVVGNLGRALYPVSKIAVKELTDGLNALAGMIRRNQTTIQEIVGGALKALVATIKTATHVLGPLVKALAGIVKHTLGWKTAFEALFALGIASKLAGIGKETRGVGAAAKVSRAQLGGLRGALSRLTSTPYIITFTLVAIGAEKIAAQIKALQQGYLDAQSHVAAADSGVRTTLVPKLAQEIRRKRAAGESTRQILAELRQQLGGDTDIANQLIADALDYSRSDHAAGAAVKKDVDAARRRHRAAQHHTTTHHAAQHVADVFGTPPPFDKNVPHPRAHKPPAPPLIPPLAAHAEALASANASRASGLHNVGRTAKRYLENELADLEVADKALRDKWEHAAGRARTQLFAAMTRVENQERTVRERIKHALKNTKDHHAEHLALAVEQAKLAVERATEGTAAYDRAVKAEEKALKAEIAYWDKRAHNSHLSDAARKKALGIELGATKELKGLLKQNHAAATDFAAARDQFLADFMSINASFAPNAQGTISTGKLESHGYDTVNGLRRIERHLADIKNGGAFPASYFDREASNAVYG